jgi:hypothetical protein
VTTPDTNAVRAWARKNGYDVADRGRLPVEVQEAYARANDAGGGRPATAKPATPRSTAAKAKSTTTKRARKVAPKAPARSAAAASSSAAATPQVDEAQPSTPKAKPSPVADDRRLVALGEELAALTERVAALEAASGGKAGSTPIKKGPRFRRSR